MNTLGIWIAAFLTLCIYSFLFKDNPFYKFAEHLFVGVSAGYWVAKLYTDTLVPNLYIPLKTDIVSLTQATGGLAILKLLGSFLVHLIPGVLGVMMLCRLFPKIAWISRWSLAFVVGTTAGITIVTRLQADVIAQVSGTLENIFAGGNWVATLNNLILLVGVICGLIYFFFSREHKGIVFGGASRIGIYFLMVAFGASFGYTVMARISLLIGRMQFLIFDWLGSFLPIG